MRAKRKGVAARRGLKEPRWAAAVRVSGQLRVPPRLLRKYALRLWTTAQDAGKCLFRLSLQLATTTVSRKQLFKHLSKRNRRSSWRLRKARIKYPWA